VPRAIIAVRRAIVSHEAIANSAIISGSVRARLPTRLIMM